MTESPLPAIRLKPKTDTRRLRRGFPWVYDNELVTDRRTKALAPGTLAVLQDAARQDLGLVTVNPGSRIFARLLDRDVSVRVDAAWLAQRVRRALALRVALYEAPFYRLIHAEADGFPGVIVDRFGDVLVFQPNAAWAHARADLIAEVLSDITGATTVILNGQGRARALEGLPEELRVLRGSAPEAPIAVPMNGAIYMADVMGGQKTGLFYDQRENHAFAARLSRGQKVLDVFSHVGGFGLAALAAGAESALAVDGSAPALALAGEGAKAMDASRRFATRKGDAFDAMTALADEGARFGLVVCDPPAFAPSKRALEAGLRAYEKVARQGAALVEPGGALVLCSCSHAAEPEKFRAACLRGIGKAGRVPVQLFSGGAGPDHPQLPALAESGYLKALAFRL